MASKLIIRHALRFTEIPTALAVMMTCQAMYALALPLAYRCITLREVDQYRRVAVKVLSPGATVSHKPQRKLSLTYVRYLKLILSSSNSEPVPIPKTLGMVQLASQRKSQSEGQLMVDRVLPPISVTTSCLRQILHSICIQNKQVLDRFTIPERRQWLKHGGNGQDRLFNAVPFCRVKHLAIAPFEFPAVGASGLRDIIGAFESVQTLELHITSGAMLSKVWMANLLEMREHVPFITKLILVFCDSSIFNADHLNLTLIPPWINLESLHIHLKNSYTYRRGGREWRFNEGQGRFWTTRLINQIRRLRDGHFVNMTRPPAKYVFQVSSLTLHLPAQSTFVWDPSEVVEAFEASQEQSELDSDNRLTVFVRFDEESPASEVLDVPEESDLPEEPATTEEVALNEEAAISV